MKIIAALISKNSLTISPFLEYLQTYTPLAEESSAQTENRVKQITHIKDSIKYLWEHNGAMNLPPLIEPYKNRKVSIIKIRLSQKLLRIAFTTIKGEIILLEAVEKPKRYENATKNKVDRKIQQFLDDAEELLELYLKEHNGIDITDRIIPKIPE